MAEGKRDFRYLSLDLSRSSPGCSCRSRSGAPTKYKSSSMRSVSIVGGASRSGTVSSLCPGLTGP